MALQISRLVLSHIPNQSTKDYIIIVVTASLVAIIYNDLPASLGWPD